MNTKITVPEAAALMNVDPQFLRNALQQNKFDFGVAVKMRKKWSYYINSHKFYDYILGRTGAHLSGHQPTKNTIHTKPPFSGGISTGEE